MRTLSLLFLSAIGIGVVPAAYAPPPISRIAFGSCASQEKPQPIWDAIIAARPELFLFLGDNIYGDTDNTEILKQKYAQLGAVPGFQKLIKTCPILATWDDHDYGTDDAGAEFRNKAASQRVFLDFFNEPANSPRRKREGVYSAMTIGPPGRRTQVILLDTRYFRSPLKKSGSTYTPNSEPGATILGEEQWKWLGEQLREPADLRLIGSSIQVVAEDHPFEKWSNFPAERARLFKLLRDTKANGVVFLSGDRHLAEISQTDAGLGYPLFDVTSSGLNMGNRRWRTPEANKHRVATMPFGDNFGFIVVNWEIAPPSVRLQIRDVAGEVTIQQKFELPLLTPSAEPVAVATAPPTKPPTVPTPMPPTPAPAAAVKTPGAVTVPEAIKKVGEKVTLEFKVKATGKTQTNSRVFLNSTVNRNDDDNFTVVLVMKDVGDALKTAGVTDPVSYYKNKTVRVTGTVTLYQDRPQIVVEDAATIAVVE
jgi:alkaline phosphatase D